MPLSRWIKCNTNGAFYEHWKGASGVVFRNDNGDFVRGSAKWYGNCFDTLTMEALAYRDGLVLVQQAGAQRVWLESDCQELLKLWSVGENNAPVW
jgi:hypothetical protein